MATLYVENVPDDVYRALKDRARLNRSSISAEVIALLAQNVPTAQELARRKDLLKLAVRLQARRARTSGPSSEEMLREHRAR